MNQPGSFVHWSIFDVSVANLVLNAVIVVIFGAALLLPFPRGHRPEPADTDGRADGGEAAGDAAAASEPAGDGTARMWTARVRGLALKALPPGKLLPDRQPAYVASWIYVFGVGSLAALGVAFVASVIECFTGYLSQQNFDSQWIATSGKDAFNSVGVGAFLNVTNFGQMLIWHIVLIPIVLIAITGAHVLLVRMRGVSHPIGAHAAEAHGHGRSRRRAIARADAAPWRGPNRRYDILKEGTIATVVILALTFGLVGLLSSPDVPPVTIATWARLARGPGLRHRAAVGARANRPGGRRTARRLP